MGKENKKQINKLKVLEKEIDKSVEKIELQETLEDMKTIIDYEDTYKLAPSDNSK